MGIHDDYEFMQNMCSTTSVLYYSIGKLKNICVHDYETHSKLINYMTSGVILKLNKLMLCLSTSNFFGIKITYTHVKV